MTCAILRRTFQTYRDHLLCVKHDRDFKHLTLLVRGLLDSYCDKSPPNQLDPPAFAETSYPEAHKLIKNFCRRLLRLALKPSEAYRLLTTTPKTCSALGAALSGGFPSDIRGNAADSNVSAFLPPEQLTCHWFSFVRLLLYQATPMNATPRL